MEAAVDKSPNNQEGTNYNKTNIIQPKKNTNN